MIKIWLNNKEILVKKGLTILQVCELFNVEIPRFCYHDELSIAGNCRMCLVEIEKSMKPAISCAVPVVENMRILTTTEKVRKIRESVLEFLLANHPLDCPVCDQGGECDLQDQTILFGSDRGRFYEYKRAVSDKEINNLVKTVMTSCIHCTRCIRFFDEVVGTNFLVISGRGSKMEIGTYLNKIILNEFSGNIVDLCPVGALTSQPYAFIARPWELKKTESIDVIDSVGSPIIINSRNNEILRILPDTVNNTNKWISDRTRYFFESLNSLEVKFPLYSFKEKKITLSWKKAFFFIKSLFKLCPSLNLFGLSGSFLDLNEIIMFKKVITKFGGTLTNQAFNKQIKNDFQDFFFFPSDIFSTVDFFLFVGLNPRLEFPIYNLELRRVINKHNVKNVYTIGLPYELNYNVKNISNDFKTFIKILEGRHLLSILLFKSQNPLIFLSEDVFNTYIEQNGFDLVLYLKNLLKTKLKNVLKVVVGFKCLSLINFYNLCNIKFVNFIKNKNKMSIFYFLNTNEIKINNKNNFLIYQGFKLPANLVDTFNLFLPTKKVYSYDQIFLNAVGHLKKNYKSVVSDLYSNTEIFLMLLKFVFKLNYKTRLDLSQVFNYIHNFKYMTQFKIQYPNKIFISFVNNFYMVNFVLRNSKVMSACSKFLKQSWQNNYK